MTIVEAIKSVLNDAPEGLSAKEIFDEIIRRNLYSFGAKNPLGVVNSQIRRRCVGLDFPTAYPVKVFRIVGHRGKKNRFALYDDKLPLSEDVHSPKSKDIADELPEERIGTALREHMASIKQQVLDCILNDSPAFFEHLVLDLLLKMGYGYGEQAGVVTGRPHDGGIDGIISEDKLGLDLIYFQAKRYSTANKVGRSELQAFIGAMEHVQKGVYITTSKFTKEAAAFIEKQQQKNVKLIDGDFLSELLVRYEVGVASAQTISIYKIDAEYFNICGGAYVGTSRVRGSKGQYWIAYGCNIHHRHKDACNNKEISKPFIEGVVLEKLSEYVFHDKYIPRIAKEYNQFLKGRNSDYESEVKGYKKQLTELDKNINSLVEMLMKTQSQVLLDKLRSLEEEKMKLESKLQGMISTSDILQVSEAQVKEAFSKIREHLKAGDLKNTKQVIDTYVSKIIVYPQSVEIRFNFFPSVTLELEEGGDAEGSKKDCPIRQLFSASHQIYSDGSGGEGATNAQRNIFAEVIYVNPLLLWASKQTVEEIVDEIGGIGDWLPIFLLRQ